jgi:tetratricopeptide (TPR) repeat protein
MHHRVLGRALRRLTWIACAGVLFGSATAFAQSSSDQLARRHFDSGVAYLEESDYDNALQAFQKAYDLSKRPEILLNLATVHERKAELSAAVDALTLYLSQVPPNDEHVETVKLRIQNLQKRIADEKNAPAANTPAPAAAGTPAPAATPAPPAALTPVPAAPAAAQPNRMPAFIALGVGGLAGGASLVTGLMASSQYDDKKKACSPHCTDSDLSSGRTLAVTSTVLTGVAIVGVGVGVTLLLTSGGSPEQARSLWPRLELHTGATAAKAQASWQF